MDTFTLKGDLHELIGDPALRVTVLRLRSDRPLPGDSPAVMTRESPVAVIGGKFNVQLPAASVAPEGSYLLTIICEQLDQVWVIDAGAADTTIDMSDFATT